VLIEGMPAAHLSCTAACTGATSAGPAHPPPPGPPPPIVSGAAGVLIHNMPAARWAPAPDTGACGVFLGDSKQSAARTVFIGDAGGGMGKSEMAVLAAMAVAGSAPEPMATPQTEALAEAGEEGVPLVEKCPYAHDAEGDA